MIRQTTCTPPLPVVTNDFYFSKNYRFQPCDSERPKASRPFFRKALSYFPDIFKRIDFQKSTMAESTTQEQSKSMTSRRSSNISLIVNTIFAAVCIMRLQANDPLHIV